MLSLYTDCEVLVTIARRQKNRSKEQLAYLWGVVYPSISDATGHSPEELHDIYKTKYLRKKVKWKGAEIVVVRSTSVLSTNGMAEFITDVITDASTLGIVVPEADKLYAFK